MKITEAITVFSVQMCIIIIHMPVILESLGSDTIWLKCDYFEHDLKDRSWCGRFRGDINLDISECQINVIADDNQSGISSIEQEQESVTFRLTEKNARVCLHGVINLHASKCELREIKIKNCVEGFNHGTQTKTCDWEKIRKNGVAVSCQLEMDHLMDKKLIDWTVNHTKKCCKVIDEKCITESTDYNEIGSAYTGMEENDWSSTSTSRESTIITTTTDTTKQTTVAAQAHKTGLLVAGVVGGIVGGAVITAVAFFVWRFFKRQTTYASTGDVTRRDTHECIDLDKKDTTNPTSSSNPQSDTVPDLIERLPRGNHIVNYTSEGMSQDRDNSNDYTYIEIDTLQTGTIISCEHSNKTQSQDPKHTQDAEYFILEPESTPEWETTSDCNHLGEKFTCQQTRGHVYCRAGKMQGSSAVIRNDYSHLAMGYGRDSATGLCPTLDPVISFPSSLSSATDQTYFILESQVDEANSGNVTESSEDYNHLAEEALRRHDGDRQCATQGDDYDHIPTVTNQSSHNLQAPHMASVQGDNQYFILEPPPNSPAQATEPGQIPQDKSRMDYLGNKEDESVLSDGIGGPADQ